MQRYRTYLVYWTTHGWTDTIASRQLVTTLTDTDNNLTCRAVDPGIALEPVCIQWVIAINASWTVRLGILQPAWIIVPWSQASESGKLAAHRHHGKAPAASWFQVRTSKRSFIMAQTPPWLQSVWGSFGGLSSPFSSQKAASIPNNTSLVDSKFQNAIPEMEPLMYPPAQHIAFDLGYI